MNKANILSYILAVCALVVVVLLIRKEFFLDTYSIPEPIRKIGNIDTLNVGGIQVGTDNAEVTIIGFYDYECQYCKKFQESVDHVKDHFGGRVQVRYVHFPLSIHENAMEAAFAAECADRQNRFLTFHTYLFDNQSRLDTISWQNVSENIGIPDGQEFVNCIVNREPFRSVEGGIMAANQLGINSIPTFLINGKMYKGAMPSELLEQLVQSELE